MSGGYVQSITGVCTLIGECNIRYNPKAGLLPDGEYDATIVSAIDKISTNGNEMIELLVRVYAGGNQAVEIKDWAMDALPWKLRHLCRAVNHDFESGELSPGELLEQNIRVKVATEKSDKYGEQNRIADYLGPASTNGPSAVADSDIPF